MTDDESPPPAIRPITRLERRIIEAAALIGEADDESPEFMHSVLCHVGLPRGKTDARSFERSSGNASIMIEAGKLWQRSGWQDQPLPYGAKPRLVLMHLCSEAVRTQSPEIEVGRSAREFLGRLGLDAGGHEYARFRAQMESLAACRMMIGWTSPDQQRSVTINTQPISRFEAWMQHDHKSLGLWPGVMTLSGEFFGSLLHHAVPLDPRAIHALQHSALALDVYAWLAHRLCRVKKAGGVTVSWRNLKDQFGQEYKTAKNFKHEFRPALQKVAAVYPHARFEPVIGGLKLYPSPPPIKKTSVLVGFGDK